ncbi:MAG TPA: serine/threonine-protein kinase [Polyangiaceae bacterium]|nr:serine/threonine-protein kinase [Polyangiaceae bacterium]
MPARDPRLDGLPAQGELLGGKYRVERTINIGRIAVVVEGTDVQQGHRVAIKILAGEAAQSARRLARFNREGSAGTTIQSEHVVRVFELGTFERGAFMVMEFLEGEDLAQVIKRGPLPFTTAVDYFLQAAEVIAEAHQLGIVHRDLKPANLFVARRADGSPCIKLLDFGIAKFGDGITTTDSFLGSPLYMAPEQLASSKEADARADIWALGTLLFELISGTTPFPLQSLTEVCTAILYAEPRRLREVAPHAPAELEAAIARCLRKNRDERFSNVAALAAAVARFGGYGASASMANIMKVSSRPRTGELTDSRSDADDELPTMRYVASDFLGPPAHHRAARGSEPSSPVRAPPETVSGSDPSPLAVTSDEPPPRRRSAAAIVFGTLGALVCMTIGGLGAYFTFKPSPSSSTAAPAAAPAPPTEEPRKETRVDTWPPPAPPSASAAPPPSVQAQPTPAKATPHPLPRPPAPTSAAPPPSASVRPFDVF